MSQDSCDVECLFEYDNNGVIPERGDILALMLIYTQSLYEQNDSAIMPTHECKFMVIIL